MNFTKGSIPIISAIFLSFLGYYIVLLILFSLGLSSISRFFTIPIRLGISAALILFFVSNRKELVKRETTPIFLIFSCVFTYRIIIDDAFNNHYYLSTLELLFYFISFCALPFLSISTIRLNSYSIERIARILFFSCVVFSFLSFGTLYKYIGLGARLSANTTDEDVISPLVLTYCSSFVIGFLLTFLLRNKIRNIYKILAVISLLFSIVIFFLGASRGGIFALVLPFFVMFLANTSFLEKIKTITLSIAIFTTVLIVFSRFISDTLIDRLLNTSNDIEEGNSSANRLVIWKNSFNQFIDHPIFGDKLRVDNWINYPHNIFLEVLQTMGVVGFILFFVLILYGAKAIVRVNNFHPKNFWIVNIFIQSFIQHLFSGAIYKGAWLWTSFALLISVSNSEKTIQQKTD